MTFVKEKKAKTYLFGRLYVLVGENVFSKTTKEAD